MCIILKCCHIFSSILLFNKLTLLIIKLGILVRNEINFLVFNKLCVGGFSVNGVVKCVCHMPVFNV